MPFRVFVRFVCDGETIAERRWPKPPRRGEFVELHGVLGMPNASFIVDRVVWVDDEKDGEVECVHVSRVDASGNVILKSRE